MRIPRLKLDTELGHDYRRVLRLTCLTDLCHCNNINAVSLILDEVYARLRVFGSMQPCLI
jgi:hypothetical protein